MIASMLFSFVVGLLLGLGYCYWNQIQAVYQHRDLISSGGNLVSAAGEFWNNVKKL